jgi:hypothetical protein
MMLRHMGWHEAADLIVSSMERAILAKTVTYDFARLLKGAKQVTCSAFGEAMIRQMSGGKKKAPARPARKPAAKKRAAKPSRKKSAARRRARR